MFRYSGFSKTAYLRAGLILALCLILCGCSRVSQEILDESDALLKELGEKRMSVEAGYGELIDDDLFSRITEAGQKLDSLTERTSGRFQGQTDEEIREGWISEANALLETYDSLQELVDQTAAAEFDERKAEENRMNLRVHVVNRTGEDLRDISFERVKDSKAVLLLGLSGELKNKATLAGITVPADHGHAASDLYLSCTDSTGEKKSYYLSALSGLNPEATFYIVLEPENRASISSEPPGKE